MLILVFSALSEHIGSKTAVQIRSHAQKFFDKVERGTAMPGAGAEVQEDGEDSLSLGTWSLL